MMINQKQKAYQQIRQRLLFGDFAPSSRISHVALAKQIGVSRTPVREAIRQMESEGLLQEVPGFGTFVKSLNRQELQDIYHLRDLLESDAAERATSRLNGRELQQLEEYCDEMRSLLRKFRLKNGRAMDVSVPHQWVLADLGFHILILRASGNRRVLKIVSDSKMMTAMFGFKREHPGYTVFSAMCTTFRQHCGILRAFQKRNDGAAKRLMSHHIHDSCRRALARYEWEKQRTGKGLKPYAHSLQELMGQLDKELEIERVNVVGA